MSQGATPSSLIIISLVMLFISGCWTVAAVIPFPLGADLRSVMIAAVAASNVTFLLSVLAAVFSHAGLGDAGKMRKVMLTFFSIGVAALVVSVMIFSISQIARAPSLPGYD